MIAPDGTPIAFPVTATKEALERELSSFEGLTIKLTDGIRVFAPDGSELVTHQRSGSRGASSTRRHWSGRHRTPDTMRR